MGVIQSMVDTFILTVGITPPTPEGRRVATIFIATGLFGTVAGIVGLVGFLVVRLSSH